MLTNTQMKEIKQAEKEIKLCNNALAWLFESISLFSTERCYKPDRELCKQKYYWFFPNF